VRRLVHPLLLRLWLRHAKNRELFTNIDGFRLRVPPTVFHPRFFGSSRVLAGYLVALGLTGKRVLDLGTGSGIVGLHAARAGAIVKAVDINPAAVECASGNAGAAGLVFDCRQSDLFSMLAGEKFDVVAWNPPFFPKRPGSPGDAAFYAGDRYEVISRFAGGVRDHLAPQGRIFLVLSMDLDLSEWNKIFAEAGLRLDVRSKKRWGWETMVIVEIAAAAPTDSLSGARAEG
jgi:HemK-related putative methylase